MPAAPCLHAYVGAEGETLAEPGRYCGAGRLQVNRGWGGHQGKKEGERRRAEGSREE